MARFVVSPVLVAMLALIAVPWGAAWAQERATCSQARAHCGTQRVCAKSGSTTACKPAAGRSCW